MLTGRRALVTASSRNLGADIARALASHGASVVVTYHSSRAEAEQLVADLKGTSDGRHVAVRGDFATTVGVRAAVTEAIDAAGGGIDILVNNYGPFSMVPWRELPEQEWEAVLTGNLTAAYLASQLVLPQMQTAGWGRIVNLSAGSAYLRNHSIYGLAKAAVATFTESLALEVGPEVTVNAIAPGQIAESAPDISAVDPTFVARAVQRTPAGRLVTRGQVAELVALLCTPAFDMLTGAVLPLDGGWRFNRF